jgi:hypothetical protein
VKVGIGVITAGVRTLNPALFQHSRGGFEAAHLVVFEDVNMRGPAFSRNECLRALFVEEACDHVFMFDDDCYPLMAGWENYFLESHAAYKLEFLGLPEAFKSRPTAFDGEVVWWDGVVGCFSSQTRKCFETVGYFDPAFKGYGYEDSERHARLRRSGLCNGPGMPSLLRAPSYIFSEDVYARNPTPNLTVAEKQAGIARNRDRFIQECNSTRIHVAYEPA